MRRILCVDGPWAGTIKSIADERHFYVESGGEQIEYRIGNFAQPGRQLYLIARCTEENVNIWEMILTTNHQPIS
ncbi:TPA: hypothetical protein ACYZE8_002379 [Salmonella enterica]